MGTKIGDWVKPYGADWGAVYTKDGWKSFKCLVCARADGLIPGKRLQNSPVTYGVRLMNGHVPGRRGKWDHACGGPIKHTEIHILNKKNKGERK